MFPSEYAVEYANEIQHCDVRGTLPRNTELEAAKSDYKCSVRPDRSMNGFERPPAEPGTAKRASWIPRGLQA
ncbi:hypothetical protein ElyMa_004142500 [Elysia marginata]|uniref:Uncharacterized protein n=1 Tax=Elysia marginata TaxID=1093978 RepID=A0AAV4GFN7_9GAST|nr:hypothetical protein ElyMa_004142500 [Elysia marginata]